MPSTLAPSARIFGTGEMADLTRAFDWSSTPLGPISHWPDPLLITVNTLLASCQPMFLWWGPELIQFYNDGYRPSFGSDKHPKALGQRGPECWPEVWEFVGPILDRVIYEGTPFWTEDHLIPIMRNGRMEDTYWTFSYSPVRDTAGNISGILAVLLETTTRKHAEAAALSERSRLLEVFQQAPAFFALLRGPDHIFEMVNKPYQQLVGHRDILNQPVRQAIPEASAQGFTAILDNVFQSRQPFIGNHIPIELARNAGEPLELRYLDFVYQPHLDAQGDVIGIIVLGVDVTESKRAEQVLVQTEKLAAVGRLASSIAHEINNPLEAVTNLLYLAELAAVSPETKSYIASAQQELSRVSAIANQTLRFYRQSTNPRPITAEELIDGTLPLYQGKLTNSNVRIERRDRTQRSITCFDGEIRQVLSNLIGNAIDAMSSTGGRLLIRTREGHSAHSGTSGVFITIADTGTGMSPATLNRIFEPFFTTKGISGTGLGLWISQEIIERHHGTIRTRSSQSVHHGTVFTIFLPCNDIKTA